MLPLRGSLGVEVSAAERRLARGEVRPRRSAERVQRGDRLRLRRPRQHDRSPQRRRRGGGAPGCALQHPSRGSLRRRRGRPRRDPRCRQRQSPGQQLRRARGVGARREAGLLRADHAARQLVELPTAQARRVGAVRGGQRGDLLLPDRRTRPGHPLPHRPAATTGPTPARSTRRPGSRRSTRRSRCATTTWYSSRTATTVRAWRRTATRCTTSTRWPARRTNARWRSATIRPMLGPRQLVGRGDQTRAARSPRRPAGRTASFPSYDDVPTPAPAEEAR